MRYLLGGFSRQLTALKTFFTSKPLVRKSTHANKRFEVMRRAAPGFGPKRRSRHSRPTWSKPRRGSSEDRAAGPPEVELGGAAYISFGSGKPLERNEGHLEGGFGGTSGTWFFMFAWGGRSGTSSLF